MTDHDREPDQPETDITRTTVLLVSAWIEDRRSSPPLVRGRVRIVPGKHERPFNSLGGLFALIERLFAHSPAKPLSNEDKDA